MIDAPVSAPAPCSEAIAGLSAIPIPERALDPDTEPVAGDSVQAAPDSGAAPPSVARAGDSVMAAPARDPAPVKLPIAGLNAIAAPRTAPAPVRLPAAGDSEVPAPLIATDAIGALSVFFALLRRLTGVPSLSPGRSITDSERPEPGAAPPPDVPRENPPVSHASSSGCWVRK